MGNSDLRKICTIEEPEESFIKGNIAVVDGNNWLYKYITTISRYTLTKEYKVNGNKLPNLIGIPRGLKRFYKKDITPIFVFDGDYNDLKKSEVEKRKQKKKKAIKKKKEALDDNDKITAAKMTARSQRITNKIMETTKEILDIMKIQYISSPESADAQASHMCINSNKIKYMISDDYDSILFGSPYTIRNITSSERKTELLNRQKTHKKHGINQNDLINLAILCGTDYNEGIKGVGPKTSLKLVTKYDSLEKIMNEKNYQIDNHKEIKQLFLNPKVKNFEIKNYQKPNIEKLQDYLFKNKGISKRHVKKSINSIKNNMNQTKLEYY